MDIIHYIPVRFALSFGINYVSWHDFIVRASDKAKKGKKGDLIKSQETSENANVAIWELHHWLFLFFSEIPRPMFFFNEKKT